jgi:hypothetical protein
MRNTVILSFSSYWYSQAAADTDTDRDRHRQRQTQTETDRDKQADRQEDKGGGEFLVPHRGPLCSAKIY